MYKLLLTILSVSSYVFGYDGISYVSKSINFECDKENVCFVKNIEDIKYKNVVFNNCLIELNEKYIICNSVKDSYYLKINDYIKSIDNTIIIKDPLLETNLINIRKIGGY